MSQVEARPRRLLRTKEVLEASGLRKTQLMLHVAQDEFPKPIKVTPSGRTIAWFEDEVAEWQKARAAERDGGGSQDCEVEASARCL